MPWRIRPTARCGSPTSWPCAGCRSAQAACAGVWSRHDLLTKHERLLRLEKATAGQPIELSPEQAKLFTNKMPVTAVQTLNNEVLPTFEEQGVVIDAVLSDNGREFCGCPDRHPYELFLQLEGIAHKTTRVGRPQSNGIVERLHRTLLDEHRRVQGRTVWHETTAEMQIALDAFLVRYNRERPHQGRGMNGRTPLQAFLEGRPLKPKPIQENQPEPIAA